MLRRLRRSIPLRDAALRGALVALLAACADPPKTDPSPACVATEEVCNGADDDCDGRVDEEVGEPWYLDADGDGWGEARWTPSCEPVDGLAPRTGDCDDADPARSPGAAEACGGGDEDCDGEVDEADAVGCVASWTDADGDGLGAGEAACLCVPEATVDGDCDDTDPDRGVTCEDGPVGAPDVAILGEGTHTVIGWRLGAGASGLFVSGGNQTTWLLPDPRDGAVGEQAAARFDGGAWMAAGDLGGDGVDDAVFVRAGGDTRNDRWFTYVFAGPFEGELGLDAAAWTHEGPVADYLGWYSAAFPGDVDADGAPDLLVGCPESAATDRVWRLTPEGDEVLFSGIDLGTRLVGPGDLDGDGVDDLALGEGDAGVHVFDGPADEARTAADARASLTVDLALLGAAGDVDGDGLADLLVGAAGRVWVVPGPVGSGAVDEAAVARLGGEDADDLRHPSASAADTDGDGRADVLVGDLQRGGGGAAYLVHGPLVGARDLATADLRLYGAANEDYFGGALVLEPGRAWIGASGDDTVAYQAGVVYGASW